MGSAVQGGCAGLSGVARDPAEVINEAGLEAPSEFHGSPTMERTTVIPSSRRDLLKALLAAGLGAATGVVAFGYEYERQATEVVRAALPVVGLPRALHGLTIGLITDLHHSEHVSFEHVANAARLLVDQKPDVIVLGGDYVTSCDRRYIEPCADALSTLTAPNGVFAVTGNHDDDVYVPRALRARGFEVLADSRTDLTVRGEPLSFAGIRFETHHLWEIDRLVRGAAGTTILLAHDPRRLTEAAALRIPAVLSGHTHGGQIVLPFLGTPVARQYPVLEGLAQRGATAMFVSRGVGTVNLPLRINCPPDVSVVRLDGVS